MNKKGFVLAETLVVTIFILFIFSTLYYGIVPLLGRYNELSFYDDLDTTYDVYQYKKLLENDGKYTEIINNANHYQIISCNDFENVSKCDMLDDIVNKKEEDILLYLDLNNKSSFISFNDEIDDYLKYINLNDRKILLLEHNGYISYVELDQSKQISGNYALRCPLQNYENTTCTEYNGSKVEIEERYTHSNGDIYKLTSTITYDKNSIFNVNLKITLPNSFASSSPNLHGTTVSMIVDNGNSMTYCSAGDGPSAGSHANSLANALSSYNATVYSPQYISGSSLKSTLDSIGDSDYVVLFGDGEEGYTSAINSSYSGTLYCVAYCEAKSGNSGYNSSSYQKLQNLCSLVFNNWTSARDQILGQSSYKYISKINNYNVNNPIFKVTNNSTSTVYNDSVDSFDFDFNSGQLSKSISFKIQMYPDKITNTNSSSSGWYRIINNYQWILSKINISIESTVSPDVYYK